MNTFPNNLSRLRKTAGLKQEELAVKLNVTRQTVSGWETGRRQPDLDTLKQIADVLGADVHELIYGDKPEAYPRFQRRHVTATAVCSTVLLSYLVFLVFFQRLAIAYCNSHYLGYPRMLIMAGLPTFGLFSGGMLVPSVMALYTSIKLRDTMEKNCLLFGILLGAIPILLLISTVFGFYGSPFFLLWRLTFSDAGRALVLYVLPFVSGFFLRLGYISKTEI